MSCMQGGEALMCMIYPSTLQGENIHEMHVQIHGIKYQ